MKALSTLRYILFATMILGSFANFALNEYGFTMLSWSHGLIGLLFFIEAFVLLKREYSTGKRMAFYLFIEHFLLGCFFTGPFFKFQHWAGASAISVFSSLFLFILYFIFGLRLLIRESKYGRPLAIIVFLFIIATILAVEGLTFKTMRWPGSYYMMLTALIAFLLFIISSFIKRKYMYKGEEISLYRRLMLLPGKPVMTFSYSGLWVVYIFLIMWDVAPNFYTRSSPPVFDQLRSRQDERAELYITNYNSFFEKYGEEE
ncbi:MAG: hypothetical protein ACJ76F_05125 [Bacteroidia bacterium]